MLLTDVVHHAVGRYGEQEAIVCGKHRLTYTVLVERACRLVAGLYRLGCKPGDRIAMISQNCHRVVELYIAAALSGLVATPMKVQYPLDELRDMVLCTGPSLILAAAHDEEKVRATAPISTRIILWDDDAHEQQYAHATGGGEYEWLIAHNDPFGTASLIDEDTLFALIYTTGSTGKQKPVMITQRAQVETVLSEFAELRFPTGTYVQSGSLLFSSGVGMVVQSLLTGGKQILLNGNTPEPILHTMQEERADGARFQPSLVHVQNASSYNLSSLRYMMQGGYHLNAYHFQQFIEHFGPILVHGYGCTEAGAVSSLVPDEYWRAGTLDERYIFSCGRAVPGVTIRIVDAEGQPLPAGVAGEVLVQTKALAPGYWRHPAATEDAFRDGWLHTHDLGRVDEQGYLYLEPRNENPGGIPTFQAIDVDSVLCRHPAVADVATFARPTPDGQRNIVAVVEVLAASTNTVTEDALLRFCRQHLAAQDIPTRIHLIDFLPRNTSGKILRRNLRERYLPDNADY